MYSEAGDAVTIARSVRAGIWRGRRVKLLSATQRVVQSSLPVKSLPPLSLPRLLGFAAGASPFRVKGHVYQGLFESTDKRCPGGVAAVLPRLADEELQTFFQQKFLAASFYDLLPLLEFGREAAHLAGVPYSSYVRGGARLQAEKDVNGLYRALLRLASPNLVVSRMPRALVQYMNFGQAEGRMTAERTFEIVVRGVPEAVQVWLTAAAEGFVPYVLETAGATEVTSRAIRATPDETVNGVQLVRGGVVFKWT